MEDQLVDDGGDAAPLTHKGTKLEADWAQDGSVPDPPNITNSELECVLQLTEDSSPIDATQVTRMAEMSRRWLRVASCSLPTSM